jgi:hypothetical protein
MHRPRLSRTMTLSSVAALMFCGCSTKPAETAGPALGTQRSALGGTPMFPIPPHYTMLQPVGFQAANGLCLQVAGGSQSAGAGLVAATCNAGSAQQFQLNDNGTLVNSSGYCLDDGAGGSNLQFLTCNGSASQVWLQHGALLSSVQSTAQTNGAYSLSAPSSSGGAVVLAATSLSNAAESWQVVNITTSITGLGNKCLEVGTAWSSHGVQIDECGSTTSSQTFTFTSAGEILNAGLCLTGSTADDTVQMATCNSSSSQIWTRIGRLIKGPSTATGTPNCLSLTAASATNHVPVSMAECDNSDPQQWIPQGYYQHGAATLLIVVPDAWSSELSDFVTHKQAIGIATKVVTVSQLQAGSASGYPLFADDAETLKHVIEDAYRSYGTQYVLLAGDAANVPVRYREVVDGAHGDVPAGQTHSFTLADLYYENLYSSSPAATPPTVSRTFDPWDSNTNGLYNTLYWVDPSINPDNVEGFPDLVVGRVPSWDPSVLHDTLAKIISYENQNPRNGGSGLPGANHYAFATDACYPSYTDTTTAFNWLGVPDFNAFAEEVGTSCTGCPAGSPSPAASPPSGPPSFVQDPQGWTAFQSAVEQNGGQYQWISYFGHGGIANFGCNDSTWYNALVSTCQNPAWQNVGCEASGLVNSNFSINTAVACQTADWTPDIDFQPLTTMAGDYDTANDSGSLVSIGSRWIANPVGGAVAFVGESIVSPDEPGTILVGSMFGANMNGFTNIGDLVRQSKEGFFYSDPFLNFNEPRVYGSALNLLGDPSMRTYGSPGGTFVQTPGALVAVTAGNTQSVWGVNASNNVFRWSSGAWQLVSGAFLTQISAGADGDTWGVYQTGNVYHWTGSAFQNVTGSPAITQVAVGNGQAVWAIDSSSKVYQWNMPKSNQWNQIPGAALTQISVGSDGDMWGLYQGAAYHFSTSTQNFVAVTAPSLSALSVGNAQNVWGLDASGQVWAFNGGTGAFAMVPGVLKTISVGADGDVWGTTSANAVYHFQTRTQTFVQVAGTLSTIVVAKATDVGDVQSVWGLDASGDIFRFDAAVPLFERIPGSIDTISVGADGDAWGIDAASNPYHFNPRTQTFAPAPGSLSSIAVGNAQTVWGINGTENVYRWGVPTAGQWNIVGGPSLAAIASGSDGDTWGINQTKTVYHWMSGAFQPILSPAPIAQVAVGNQRAVWAIDSSQSVYRWNVPMANQWNQISGAALTQIAVGADGDVWGTNSANAVYHFNTQTQTFASSTFVLNRISVGNAQNVWGLYFPSNSAQLVYALSANGTAVMSVPAGMTTIAASASGAVWAVNSFKQAFAVEQAN